MSTVDGEPLSMASHVDGEPLRCGECLNRSGDDVTVGATTKLSVGRLWMQVGAPPARHVPAWHDPRTIQVMFRVALTLVFMAGPATASAQVWADAYKVGDYKKAAHLLHPIVIQLAMDPSSQDADPSTQLAMMYAAGLGVPQDPVAACSLAQVAMQTTIMSAPKFGQNTRAYDASVKEADAFFSKQCETRVDYASTNTGPMKASWFRTLVLLGVLSMIGERPLLACTCAFADTPCHAVGMAEAVFVGFFQAPPPQVTPPSSSWRPGIGKTSGYCD